MLTLGVLGAFAGVLVLLLVVLFAGDSRWEVRQALARIQSTQIDNMRQAEMLASLRNRVLEPAMAGLSKLSGRFTPAGYVDSLRHKLTLAGNPAGLDADRFLA
ncbi:MAG: hypothetical protein ACRDY7_01470, partial [Acidimicrobiia bacterium]